MAIERVESKARRNLMQVVMDVWRVAYRMKHREMYQRVNQGMNAGDRLEAVMIRESKPSLTDVIFKRASGYE